MSRSTPISRRQWLKQGGAAFVAATCAPSLSVTLAAEESASRPLRLVTRADDLGCAQALNEATLECVKQGIAKNVSVLAPTPYVEEAAEMFRGVDGVCFGLHSALNSEWTSRRWGPVAPKDKVRSLMAEDGSLHQYPQDLRTVDPDEALIEFSAQLNRARKLGFDIRYVDSHMGAINNVPGLADKFRAWCDSEKVIDYRRLDAQRLPMEYDQQLPDNRLPPNYPQAFLAALQSAPRQQTYLVVSHPGYENEEIQSLGHRGYPGDAVANNLNLQRRMFTDADIVEYCQTGAVELLRYDDVVNGKV